MTGELIEIKNNWIVVRCTSVAKDKRLQDKICEKCKFHSHPLRAKGYGLHCRMV